MSYTAKAQILWDNSEGARTICGASAPKGGPRREVDVTIGNDGVRFTPHDTVHCPGGNTEKKPGIRQVVFECEDVETAEECVRHVRESLGGQGVGRVDAHKKVLLILNPVGGTKKAMKIYRKVVAPMFRLAGRELELKPTKYALHATEIARSLDTTAYSALLTLSGDGVFHEVVNGLLTRPDWEEARKLPVGFIGGGSANAMSRNIDALTPELAALAVIQGETRPMDVFSVTQNGVVTYSHLQVMWALLADLDIESDRYRWLGSERFTLAAIIRLIKLRTYRGNLYYLPVNSTGQSGTLISDHSDSATDMNGLAKRDGFAPPMSAEHTRLSLATSDTQLLPLSSATPVTIPPETTPNHGPARIYTAPNSPPYTSWPSRLNCPFTFFVATNLPWISADFLTSPQTRLNDGALNLIWSETMSRWQGLQSVLDQGSGAYLKFDFVRSEMVKAFVLEPEGWTYDSGKGPGEGEKKGILDVSGEEVAYGPVRVEVHPGALRVVTPPWLDEEEWSRRAK
ncbi:hypothetical protein HDV00_006480 [Rhizophlyctis rosea]|nr:hypothetical protein HDV00_006480 [Rhizophlyctis rosea]